MDADVVSCGIDWVFFMFILILGILSGLVVGAVYGASKENKRMIDAIGKVSGTLLTPEEKFYLYMAKNKILHELTSNGNRYK